MRSEKWTFVIAELETGVESVSADRLFIAITIDFAALRPVHASVFYVFRLKPQAHASWRVFPAADKLTIYLPGACTEGDGESSFAPVSRAVFVEIYRQ